MNVTPTSLSPISRSIILQKTVGTDRCTVSLFVANALYFFWATTVYMALHFAGIDWPQTFFSSIIPGTEMLPDLCMMLAVFSGTVCYGLRPLCWQRYLLPVLATIMLSVVAFPFVETGPRLLLLAFFMALSGGVFALIFHLVSLHVAPDVTGRFFGFSTAFSLLLQSGFHAVLNASLTGFLTASVLCMGGLAMLLPKCLEQLSPMETSAAEQPAEQTPPRVDISVFRSSCFPCSMALGTCIWTLITILMMCLDSPACPIAQVPSQPVILPTATGCICPWPHCLPKRRTFWISGSDKNRFCITHFIILAIS